MSTAKLHINLAQGILDVEGDVDFVREVYKDYREGLVAKLPEIPDATADNAENGTSLGSVNSTAGNTAKEENGKRKRKAQAPRQPKEGGSGMASYKPALVNDINITDIRSFIVDYEPKNNYDYITLFIFYLESKKVAPISFNHVYTCYRDAQVKAPVVLKQAFIDARGKKGFVEFGSPAEVTLTERGRNHVQFGGLKKKDAEPA